MLKYSLSLVISLALVILASVTVIHAVDCLMSTDDAVIATYVVAPITALLMAAIVAMHDEWRCRLALDSRVERCSHGLMN